MPDIVRQNDEILRGVQQLARAEKFVRRTVAERNPRPLPPVPCMISTALVTTPAAFFTGVPMVV